MGRRHRPGRWRLSPRRTSGSETFRAQTFPHVDAVYADALCLTGRREEAADLVVAAYRRAFQGYDEFRRRRRTPPGGPSRWETLAWLYRNLHAAFCDRVLARRPSGGTWRGEHS